jgi:magnesium chelatase subunit I
VGEEVASERHETLANDIPELGRAVGQLDVGESAAGLASGVEFVLEGLHLNRRLNKERRGGGVRYAR